MIHLSVLTTAPTEPKADPDLAQRLLHTDERRCPLEMLRLNREDSVQRALVLADQQLDVTVAELQQRFDPLSRPNLLGASAVVVVGVVVGLQAKPLVNIFTADARFITATPHIHDVVVDVHAQLLEILRVLELVTLP